MISQRIHISMRIKSTMSKLFLMYISKNATVKRNCNIKEKPDEFYHFVKSNEENDFIIVRVGCKCSKMFSESIDGVYNDSNSFLYKNKAYGCF